ncbi:hypothetical protein Godav_024105, partial [Gossypium davidsonii]|nr:hypothetical protein [Gossypium davidsonii]
MRGLPSNIFARLKSRDIAFLEKTILNEEIKRALFDMDPCTQSQWDIVEQAGFINGRNISNNVIIAQKVIHSMRSKEIGKKLDVIKLDLEKASDRIFWNGVPTQKFKQIREVKHGCSLSPYLFVLCIEWLGYIIHAKIDATYPLKGILRHFCEFSGHKISAQKSNMYFSKGVEVDLCVQISQLFGFQEVHNLGIYLGVPLLHNWVTKSTLNFVVKKMRHKLQSWEARKLSIAGRITLAQSVLLAIPNYFMQSMLIRKGVCAEIKRIVRQFIWDHSSGHPKLALSPKKMFYGCESFEQNIARRINSWSPLPRVNVCTYGVHSLRNSGSAFAGSVVRDPVGNWILRFNCYLGRCTPFEVELWGILDKLLILLNKGYKRATIQIDNLEVVNALTVKGSEDSGTTLIRRIQRIMNFEGQWEIRYILRECNLIADRLAKLSLAWQSSLQIFVVPPNNVLK